MLHLSLPRRLLNRLRGRHYFAACDMGTFVPATLVVGYVDRKGGIHITQTVHEEETDGT